MLVVVNSNFKWPKAIKKVNKQASIMPWSAGKPLVWDATCSDTFAASYQGVAPHVAGDVAAQAEVRKHCQKW